MKRYRVKPGARINLKEWNPSNTGAFDGGKAEALKQIGKLNAHLEELQELLYAECRHRVLIVVQAMDTGGKDGAIRRVFEGVNPQGVRVTSFKKPSEADLSHDYLWRVHSQVPAKGEIVIFNRSHYEDVLVVRVHDLAPQEVWKRRFDHINNFERMLADEGVMVLKFFLHISRDEQKERLQARLDDPTKHWKFNPGDLTERKLWDKYMKAYEDVLSKTSTPWAPWRIVPANRKWYRDLVIASAIVETLKNLKMAYPKPDFDPAAIKIE